MRLAQAIGGRALSLGMAITVVLGISARSWTDRRGVSRAHGRSGEGERGATRKPVSSPRARVVLPVVCCSVLLIAGCGSAGDPGGRTAESSPSGQGGRAAASSPGCQVIVRGFSCLMQERIEAARSYLADAPGRIGLVLHDRVRRATWRNASARQSFPAASTVKLAMVADLLVRERRGSVRLAPADQPLIDAALRESADGAADRLWYSYENAGFLSRIRAFGMTGASFTSHAYWGAMTCSADDLSNLMDYVLNRLPDRDRDEIVDDLQNVSPVQHWGVWGAGSRNQPGTKNGWVNINGIWTVNTVGFAGQHARYTLAIMNHLGGEAGFQAGANTLTQVAAILFQGRQILAPDVGATP
jgi:hypothetical protein